MRIGTINVKISAISLAVFGIFTIILLGTVIATGETSILLWGVPILALLLIIPAALNYMSQQQYASLVPMYEQEAKTVRIRTINLSMLGEPVRIQGIVERVHFQFLNRPQYLVADRTGEISVKMFTNPQEDVKVNDKVEVLGSVVKRYILSGDAVINCISIRKITEESAPEQKKKKS
ncbi:nucleotide-binding protein [Methanoculleus sp. FWC-SCC1]|uniref:Nucleotide-binding protein n=1 Tax=Methanoculleus frigidifontis TaxID=2584085 RepID=A0ABT8M7M6_9EURY|nr:nucleotide-binding protein [Methanoculleus sp. FWC-SCC1]MDN7023931.1 nucleotide-binding protein [Methanoculleus sp. FWC-SCC1]